MVPVFHFVPSGFVVLHMQRFSPPSTCKSSHITRTERWLSKWNKILAHYGEAEFAVQLTTNDTQGHSQYVRTWQRFFFPELVTCRLHTSVLSQNVVLKQLWWQCHNKKLIKSWNDKDMFLYPQLPTRIPLINAVRLHSIQLLTKYIY